MRALWHDGVPPAGHTAIARSHYDRRGRVIRYADVKLG